MCSSVEVLGLKGWGEVVSNSSYSITQENFVAIFFLFYYFILFYFLLFYHSFPKREGHVLWFSLWN